MPRSLKALAIVPGIILIVAIIALYFVSGDRIVNQANYDRIHEGMTFEEVKAILGDPGPSYSSDSQVGYYIWKERPGWIRKGKAAWISIGTDEDGIVTDRQFRPDMDAGD